MPYRSWTSCPSSSIRAWKCYANCLTRDVLPGRHSVRAVTSIPANHGRRGRFFFRADTSHAVIATQTATIQQANATSRYTVPGLEPNSPDGSYRCPTMAKITPTPASKIMAKRTHIVAIQVLLVKTAAHAVTAAPSKDQCPSSPAHGSLAGGNDR